ncbi:hypothetical protein DXB28_02925 [Bacillus cereus]|nr:hypothetical protein DXB28_02925 [Bacillus cereus]
MKITPFSLPNEKLTYLFQYSQLISTKRSINTVNEIISSIFSIYQRFPALYRRFFKYIVDSTKNIDLPTNNDKLTPNYSLSYYAVFNTLTPFTIFQMK